MSEEAGRDRRPAWSSGYGGRDSRHKTQNGLATAQKKRPEQICPTGRCWSLRYISPLLKFRTQPPPRPGAAVEHHPIPHRHDTPIPTIATSIEWVQNIRRPGRSSLDGRAGPNPPRSPRDVSEAISKKYEPNFGHHRM